MLRLSRIVLSSQIMRERFALTVIKDSAYTTTFASRIQFWVAKTKSTTSARNATDPSISTMGTAISSIASHTTTTNASLVNADTSLLTREFAKLWILAVFVIREDSALIAFPTSDSRAINVKLRDVWISRASSVTGALLNMS